MKKSFSFLLLAIFTTSYGALCQSNNSGYKITFDENKDAVGLEFLDSSLSYKRVIFTGEDHRYIESNNNISLAFTKYLYKKFGVRHLILELGYTWGTVLDKYVQTGDSMIFEVIKKSSYVTHYEYFKDLYNFNKSLPDSEKIIITGIDITRDYTVCIHYLSYLLSDKGIPSDDIIVSIESIKALSDYLNNLSNGESSEYNSSLYSYYNSIDSIISNFYNNKSSYQALLDSNYTEFSRIIKCLEDNKIWHHLDINDMIQKFIYREQFMLKEFEKLLTQYPNDKFYGQFGRCHIGQNGDENECNWYNFRPIATRITELQNVEMKGKVMTLAIIYTDGLFYREKLSEQINDLIDTTPENSVFVYPLVSETNDSDSTEIVPSKYNYVIIDNRSKLPVSYTDSGPIYKWDDLESFKNSFAFLGYSRNYAMLPQLYWNSLNTLNRALRANSLFTDFSTPIVSQTFAFDMLYFRKKFGRGWGIDFSNDLMQHRDVDTASSVKLGGSSANFSFNYYLKLFNVSKIGFWIDWSLRLGYNSKYLLFEYNNNSRPTLIGFDNIETTKFKSSTFNIIPTFGFSIIAHETLMIGVEGGYNWQTGKTKWKQGKNIVSGPSQNWSSGFYSLKTAFIIN